MGLRLFICGGLGWGQGGVGAGRGGEGREVKVGGTRKLMVSRGNAWGSCKIHLLLCEGVFWGSFSTHHPLSIVA